MLKKYLIVNIINNVETPLQFSSKDWPLHLTILTHFVTDVLESTLVHKIADCLSNCNSFEITAKKEDLYGINADVPVTVINLTKPLMDLHLNLMKVVDEFGATYERPLHIGNGFKPHVTTLKGRKFDTEKKTRLDTVTLVEVIKLTEGKLIKVIDNFHLNPNNFKET